MIELHAFDSRLARLVRSARRHAGDVVAFNQGPLPVARTLRNGLSIGTGFVLFALTGSFETAVTCAIFTNLLVFADQLSPLRERLSVLGAAALCYALAGAIGSLIAGIEPMILLTTFAFATFAGLVHGCVPGIELIPRNAIICMVVGAYLPHINGAVIIGVLAGTLLALIGTYCEHRLAPNRSGATLATARELVSYQSPRFAVIYGAAAVGGMALGYMIGDIKPYWVAITAVVVMQPGRRASMVRAMQRFLGTMSGVIAAFALSAITADTWQHELFIALAILIPFFWPLAFARNYGLGVAILSAWILILLDLALPPQMSASALFMARLVDTAIGCALAMAANLVIEETAEAEKQGEIAADGH